MSLINEALKKAQADTSRGGPVNPMAGSLAGAHVRPQKKSPFLKLVALAIFLGVAVWAGSYFLGSSDSPHTVVELASASPSQLEAATELEAVSPEVIAESVPETSVAESHPEIVGEPTVEADSVPVVAQADVSSSMEPMHAVAVESSPTVVAPESETVAQVEAEAAPAVPPAEPEVEAAAPLTTDQALRDEIIYTLKQLEITAVMGDGSKARIMSGGQIHRAGELINLDLKIRFQGKKEKTLYFTDSVGEIYEKPL